MEMTNSETLGPYRHPDKEMVKQKEKSKLDFKCSFWKRLFGCSRQWFKTSAGTFKFRAIKEWEISGRGAFSYYTTKGNYVSYYTTKGNYVMAIRNFKAAYRDERWKVVSKKTLEELKSAIDAGAYAGHCDRSYPRQLIEIMKRDRDFEWAQEKVFNL